MIKQIGTKIYYCNLTGNVIKIIGDMQGYVKETTFKEDYLIYKELNEKEKETIGLIQLEYGQYEILSKDSTGVMVDLETKELIFSYEPIPVPPLEPTWEEKIDDKISILEGEQKAQNEEILSNMLATTEVFEMILTMSAPMSVDIENKNKNLGGNSMVEVYVTLILKGVKTIDQVPTVIREKVREQLDLLVK